MNYSDVFTNFLNRWSFILGLVLTLILLWPLFAAPYFSHHDDVQVIRLYEMHKCFQDLQIPCRWVPDLGNLYGYPLFNFYGPLPYYFGALIFTVTNSLSLSVKLMFAFPFVLSYIFMYFLVRKLMNNNIAGSLAGIFYSYAPYHSLVFYVRGAMGEMWALMCFPAIFLSLLYLSEKIKLSSILLVSFFLSVLFLSHNLSAMIFMPVVFLFVLLLAFKLNKRANFLVSFFACLIFSISLSAFYLLPMYFEKDLVHVDTTTIGYFSYTEHFKGFRKLIFERSWGYGGSVREVPGGEKDGLSFQIGIIHLLGIALGIYSLRILKKKKDLLIAFILMMSFFIYLVNPRSYYIWEILEPLKFLQFPWRFLMLIIFFASIITGVGLSVFKGKFKNIIFLGLTFLVVAFNINYFRPEKFINFQNEDFLSGSYWTYQLQRSILDYLPISAKEPPAKPATLPYTVLTGEAVITDFKKGTNWFEFKADAKSHSIVRLSQYYFPSWKIKVNGEETRIDYENTLGLMTIILGQGEHKIEGRLDNTTIRSFGNILTLLAGIAYLFLILFTFRSTRNRLTYYWRSFFQ